MILACCCSGPAKGETLCPCHLEWVANCSHEWERTDQQLSESPKTFKTKCKKCPQWFAESSYDRLRFERG